MLLRQLCDQIIVYIFRLVICAGLAVTDFGQNNEIFLIKSEEFYEKVVNVPVFAEKVWSVYTYLTLKLNSKEI